MRHLATYPGITAPRWGHEEHEWKTVKHHAPYVYGTGKNSSLVHKVRAVRLRWWTYSAGGERLVRLQSPRMTADAMCGIFFYLDGSKAKTCAIPKPDAVLCAACHGEGRNFPKNRPHKVPRELAKVKLGCVAEGFSS